MHSNRGSTYTLEEFTRRKSRYRGGGIDLNGKVTRNDVVARGGYATVYRGVLNPLGRMAVAIKTTRGGPPGDEDAINRVPREVHLWSKLCRMITFSHCSTSPLISVSQCRLFPYGWREEIHVNTCRMSTSTLALW
ncbi:hypothetical protein BKA82DRAFT_434329 [Pisolithus tinctorius]|uniref:Protein kinase domain-containing protein n=1 Tax=Pisolithus tinctorius Marx 270 TaxID=870435 RepID=A0A0C3P0D2_PISTI|nr:hypothetical protein BKA82DRAFT_434329 [Pisolithus tinctorius]KIO06560.1 hypothetical protein M404DRAFT_434329 [Pisolithus tinctorius Marx 270]